MTFWATVNRARRSWQVVETASSLSERGKALFCRIKAHLWCRRLSDLTPAPVMVAQAAPVADRPAAGPACANMRSAGREVRQATRGEVCLGVGIAARFSVPAPFNRLL